MAWQMYSVTMLRSNVYFEKDEAFIMAMKCIMSNAVIFRRHAGLQTEVLL